VTTQSVEALLDNAVAQRTKVLDIATGAGYVAAATARRGAEPVDPDFSATQVRLARERYPTIRFKREDAEALPFDADTFDTVVIAFGFCHLPIPTRRFARRSAAGPAVCHDGHRHCARGRNAGRANSSGNASNP
jgi:ubiquinone/menaquinone biosynthesis C-methylase UbiE